MQKYTKHFKVEIRDAVYLLSGEKSLCTLNFLAFNFFWLSANKLACSMLVPLSLKILIWYRTIILIVLSLNKYLTSVITRSPHFIFNIKFYLSCIVSHVSLLKLCMGKKLCLFGSSSTTVHNHSNKQIAFIKHLGGGRKVVKLSCFLSLFLFSSIFLLFQEVLTVEVWSYLQ